jgi:enolase-phosphatase E1
MTTDLTRGILLDVEGTTTPISFVYETLFPHARARLRQYAAMTRRAPEVERAWALLRHEYDSEQPRSGVQLPEFGEGAPYAEYLMDHDRKSTGLKMLQGIIWQEGYRSGELQSEVFDDVPEAFKAWRKSGLQVQIFSSGSVLAQKLLFRHTTRGDLTEYLSGYHDTMTGPKHESDSYRAIARRFNLPEAAVLFLSDVVSELDAAKAAGMATGLLLRPGNKPVAKHDHPTHSDFRALI